MAAVTHNEGKQPPLPATLSLWLPFRHRVFAVLWAATVISDIGDWMYNASSGWLMTYLDASALVVSLVQVASNLPMFLFALPAGALTDIVDKRKLLLLNNIFAIILSAIFGALVWFHLETPTLLLIFVFLIGTTSALTAPAWQAIVPLLVPKKDLPSAISANSVGTNISRAIGPAMSGLAISALGMAAPFGLNAISGLTTVGALAWWQPPKRQQKLPSERFWSAMRIGLRYARHNAGLRTTLIRAGAFFLFASLYWALLPLEARNQIHGGPEVYGLLLGAIGAGAVAVAFVLPRLKTALGADLIVAIGTVATAAAMGLYAIAHNVWLALLGSTLAGASWIGTVSVLNVSAQLALPDWVRGRGLAIFVSVFFGTMTLGSILWGAMADLIGLPATHLIGAAGMILTVPLTWRWQLHAAASIDLTPSMHWPTPVLWNAIDNDQGPVLVTIEYSVIAQHRTAFLTAMRKLEQERLRDGAYEWGLFEDATEKCRFMETFLVESWLEHLRQHERVTNADRILQEHVHRLLADAPKTTHLLAVVPSAT